MQNKEQQANQQRQKPPVKAEGKEKQDKDLSGKDKDSCASKDGSCDTSQCH